jgi:hypothetical protein
MRWVLAVALLIASLIGIVIIGGMLLPVAHVASVRARVPAPSEAVFAVLADVESAPGWRNDVDSVTVLSAAGEPLRWRETGASGSIAYLRAEAQSPRRLVARIDGTDQGFGGRWIWDLAPDGDATWVTITEEGEVYNPAFRFMARYVFGHHRRMQHYLRDLGAHFGAAVESDRVR